MSDPIEPIDPIDQIINPPTSRNPDSFDPRADNLFEQQLPGFISQANHLGERVVQLAQGARDDALSAAEDAARSEAAAVVAVGGANFKGDYQPGTLYLIGESVSFGDQLFTKKTAAPAGTVPVDGVDWLGVDKGLTINQTSGLSQTVDFSKDVNIINTVTGVTEANRNINISFSADRPGRKTNVLLDYLPFLNNYAIRNAISAGAYTPEGAGSTRRDFRFLSNGSLLDVLDENARRIRRYSLSVPYDLSSTITFVGQSSTTLFSTATLGFVYSADGTKLFVAGQVGSTSDGRIDQFSCATPFSLSVTSDATTLDTDLRGENFPAGVEFNNDGTKLYFSGYTTNDIFQYSLPTPYRLSGATYDSKVLLRPSALTHFEFTPDGSRVYGKTGSFTLARFDLSVPFDISTATLTTTTLNIGGTNLGATRFNNNGSLLFGMDAGVVRRFICADSAVLIFPSDIKLTGNLSATLNARTTYEFITTNGGGEYTLLSKNTGIAL